MNLSLRCFMGVSFSYRRKTPSDTSGDTCENITPSPRLCTKSQISPLLCATSVFSVSLWLMNSEQKHTTETQRTLRLHREFSEPGLLVQSPSHQPCLKRHGWMGY